MTFIPHYTLLGDGTLVDNSRLILETWVRERSLSEAIIERVLRLNPSPAPGTILRGIHLTRYERDEMRHMRGLVPQGEFIRRFGREAFDQVPRQRRTKCGRRVYIDRRWTPR